LLFDARERGRLRDGLRASEQPPREAEGPEALRGVERRRQDIVEVEDPGLPGGDEVERARSSVAVQE